ncbi:hypothetical protein Desal_2109 [Maridesulfovibrio salexigens DSM 2638]|uniref:Uncharacterized protein n=1 Tax=Maridesulfovibrio salexigens (strain ATCC 14822 / DSM 2638 / NCIMB 8403 / VKM B-1763) TaxID=526222 RepID=C6BVW6_MARSD|nr:hypothetical protein Desal_2109 [Maridesulfovibrio salexigens DSM 2638]
MAYDPTFSYYQFKISKLMFCYTHSEPLSDHLTEISFVLNSETITAFPFSSGRYTIECGVCHFR